jgi:hypothetical protein
MKDSSLVGKLQKRPVSVSLDNIMQNSKASSGGERDVDFLKYLMDHRLLLLDEVLLKRTDIPFHEESYSEKYGKTSYESDRHYYCRAIIQEELQKMHLDTYNGIDVGNMSILRSNSNYDVVTQDFSAIIDIGLSPARNFFRGLTDLRVKNYLITSYFDDYMDDIIFACFSRSGNEDFLNAVLDYQEGYKEYKPAGEERIYDSEFFERT